MPSSFTAVLTLTVTLPPLMAPESMIAALNAAMGSSLATALTSAGFTVASAANFQRAPPAITPIASPPPPTNAPTTVMHTAADANRRNIALAATFSTLCLILLCAVAFWGAQRESRRRIERADMRRSRAKLIGKSMQLEVPPDSSDEEEPDNAPWWLIRRRRSTRPCHRAAST